MHLGHNPHRERAQTPALLRPPPGSRGNSWGHEGDVHVELLLGGKKKGQQLLELEDDEGPLPLWTRTFPRLGFQPLRWGDHQTGMKLREGTRGCIDSQTRGRGLGVGRPHQRPRAALPWGPLVPAAPALRVRQPIQGRPSGSGSEKQSNRCWGLVLGRHEGLSVGAASPLRASVTAGQTSADSGG